MFSTFFEHDAWFNVESSMDGQQLLLASETFISRSQRQNLTFKVVDGESHLYPRQAVSIAEEISRLEKECGGCSSQSVVRFSSADTNSQKRLSVRWPLSNSPLRIEIYTRRES